MRAGKAMMLVGGSLLVHTDGVDFTRLSPAWLAIAMFVAICAAFGAVVTWWVNTAAVRDGAPRSWWFAGPPLMALGFPPVLVVAVVAGVTNWLSDEAGRSGSWWRVLQVGAFTVMSAMLVAGALKLGRDTAVLT